MVASIKVEAPPGTLLDSLIKGFVLTQRTDGKSHRTVEYYEGNLSRFLWYVERRLAERSSIDYGMEHTRVSWLCCR